MFYIILADLLLILHLLFILFVVTGGFLSLKWRPLIFIHFPSALWGMLIEFQGWICPLTPLEQQLRRSGGQAGYSGGFIAHYLLPIIYPAALTRNIQIMLGLFVVLINIGAYFLILIHIINSKKGH